MVIKSSYQVVINDRQRQSKRVTKALEGGGRGDINGGVYIRGRPHFGNRKSALKQAIAVGD